MTLHNNTDINTKLMCFLIYGSTIVIKRSTKEFFFLYTFHVHIIRETERQSYNEKKYITNKTKTKSNTQSKENKSSR